MVCRQATSVLALAGAVLLLATGAQAYGSCNEAYCVSCPSNPAVCTQCRGEAAAEWAQPLGVFASGGKCVLCVDRDPNCSACNGKTGTCTMCGPNYGVRRGRCRRCADPQCASCGPNSSKCLWCRAGYGVDKASGGCAPCKDPGCDSCGTDAKTCVQCKPGWRIVGDGALGNCAKSSGGRKGML